MDALLIFNEQFETLWENIMRIRIYFLIPTVWFLSIIPGVGIASEFCRGSASGYFCIPYPASAHCQNISDKKVDADRRYVFKKGVKKANRLWNKTRRKFNKNLDRGKKEALMEAACDEMEEKGVWKWIASSWIHPPVLTTEQFKDISARRKRYGKPMGPYVISDKK